MGKYNLTDEHLAEGLLRGFRAMDYFSFLMIS